MEETREEEIMEEDPLELIAPVNVIAQPDGTYNIYGLTKKQVDRMFVAERLLTNHNNRSREYQRKKRLHEKQFPKTPKIRGNHFDVIFPALPQAPPLVAAHVALNVINRVAQRV